MAEDKKKDVFISYCTRNSDLAQYFCSLIEGGGITCWIAPRDIPSGGDWAENIVKGLSDCSLVAFLVSEDSVASKEVAKEIGLANSFQKDLLQVRLENTSLPPAMLYHLSNKQWVNALTEEKSLRFKDTISAIRKLLNKSEVASVSDNSIIGQARKLVDQLNKTHGKILDIINTPISLQEEGPEKIRIFFPIRFGATGLDLIFEYNGQNRTIELYANGVTNGDPFNNPFFNVFIKKIGKLFPNKIFKGHRNKSIILIPVQKIPSDLVAPEQLFNTFKVNVEAFFEQVIPKLLEWSLYADQVIKAINRLEDELRKVFPKNEGWQVGAAESMRLGDLRSDGELNIYKKIWEPLQDNYHERGLLSFTMESEDDYLENVFISISKYETWHDLGEWDERIRSKANEILGQTAPPEYFFPWWMPLDKPWNRSGIADLSFNWQGKLDAFVEYCLEKFKKLKDMEGMIDNVCKDIPNLQIRNPEEIIQKKQKWNEGLYIYNKLRLIAENGNQQAREADMNVSFSSRHIDYWSGIELREIYLTFKVGDFDAVAAFTCTKRKMTVVFKNLEPPDFETEIVKSFIAKRGNYKISPTAIISVSNDFDGKSISKWLDRYASFVSSQLDLILPEFIALKEHIEKVIQLSVNAEETIASLLTPEAGWVIKNNAKSLVKAQALDIYHKSWRRDGAAPDELPPIIIQMYPEKPCFDELNLVVKLIGNPAPEIERLLGSICGACDITFGKGETNSHIGLWVRKFAEPFSVAGGSSFEKPLIMGEERASFLSYLKSVAENLLRIEPIIAKACLRNNNLDFIKNYETFFNKLVARLKMEFTEKDGWDIVEYPAINKQKESYFVDALACIAVFKKKWKEKESDKRGLLSLYIRAEKINFSNVRIGVIKEKSRPCKYDELSNILKNHSFGSFYKYWWPGCKNVGQCDPSKFGDVKEQENWINTYMDDFVKLKSIAGYIDRALELADVFPTNNDNDGKSVTSTQVNQTKPQEV